MTTVYYQGPGYCAASATGDTVWSYTANTSASTFEWQPLSYSYQPPWLNHLLRRDHLTDIVEEVLKRGIDPRSVTVEAKIGHIYDRNQTIYYTNLVTGREMNNALRRELGENWEAELAFRLLRDHP